MTDGLLKVHPATLRANPAARKGRVGHLGAERRHQMGRYNVVVNLLDGMMPKLVLVMLNSSRPISRSSGEVIFWFWRGQLRQL